MDYIEHIAKGQHFSTILYVKEMKLFRKRKKSELFKERTTSGSAQSGNTTIL